MMRYFAMDIDETNIEFQNLIGWYGVVDEEQGGFVAYFNDASDAENYAQWMEENNG